MLMYEFKWFVMWTSHYLHGHCKMILSIIGFLRNLGPTPHAHLTHEVHIRLYKYIKVIFLFIAHRILGETKSSKIL
jgi:hypothetical protein